MRNITLPTRKTTVVIAAVGVAAAGFAVVAKRLGALNGSEMPETADEFSE